MSDTRLADRADRASPEPPDWPLPHPSETSGRKPHRSVRRVGRALVSAAAALLLIGSGAGIGVAFAGTHRGGVATPAPAGSGADANASAVANRVDPAIADITSNVGSGPSSGEDVGTGLVLTPGGEVVTNNHVIAGATSIRVQIGGGARSHPARVIGADAANDVALLQVAGVSALPTITAGDSSSLALGDAVVAIGNALALGGPPTVSSGTVTALSRSIQAADPAAGTTETLSGLLQIDNPIEPGDSGGALVNSSGQVVGLITAAAPASTGAQATVGFAIPFAKVATIVDRFSSGGASA